MDASEGPSPELLPPDTATTAPPLTTTAPTSRESSVVPDPAPPLTPIHNRTLPGSCHSQNRHTLSWSRCGLLAYAAHSLVVVVDPLTLQVLQCLNKHRANVVQLVWSNNDARPLQIASADLTGHIYVWNLNSGEVLAQLQDGNQPIQAMGWMSVVQEAASDLLLAVHPPNHVILWNTATGVKVWKKQYSETILGFDLDPFDRNKLIFRCQDCFLFVNDFHLTKKPQSEGKKFYVVGGKGASPIREDSVGSSNDKGGKGARGTKLRKMMRQVVMGEGRGVLNASEKGELSSCSAVLHHKAQPNIVLAAFPKEVLILDTEIGQTVGIINLERANSPLAQLVSCRQSDVLYLLHESGSVSVWSKRKHLTVVGTPALSRSVSTISFSSTPGLVPNLKDVQPAKDTDVLLELSYESKTQSEHVRLGKNCRVLGLTINPVSEMTAAFITTDGRIFLLSLRPSRSKSKTSRICPTPWIDQHLLSSLLPSGSADPPIPLKLSITSILGGVAPPDLIIRMCPPLTIRNWTEYKPLLVAGTPSGNIQVYNMSTGVVVREMTVHTGQVRGVEWTSSNPAHTILSFAHQSVTGSTLVRNELIHTDIRTGKSKSLRMDRSEEPPIDLIKVSHLKQFFVIAFIGAPFELWDLRKLCLLRTMPKKFPPITALEWSPLHNFKSKKKMSVDSSSEKNDCDSTPPSQSNLKKDSSDCPNAIPISPSLNSIVNVKEHIVLTDQDGQLYHFSVEGNSIKDGTKIPAESGLGTVTTICWKSDLIIRGDSEGNINIWNVKTRQSKNINTGNGSIKRMRFSPGKQNMKLLVLHPDCVAIWDVKELELINDLRTPRDIGKIVDIEWAASDRAVLACQDGAVRMMGLALSGSTSPVFTYSRSHQVSCPALLPVKQFQNYSAMLAHQPWRKQYSLEFSEVDGWTGDQLQFLQSQVDLIPEHQKAKLLDPSTSPAQRCFLSSIILGSCYDTVFWEVVCWALDPSSRSLSYSHDLLADSATYLQRQTDKCKLHLNRCADRKSRLAVTSQLLCLQQLDPAVNLLLETEPDDPQYLSDQLLACLVSMTTYTEGAPLSTTKMVATNLIAEGRLWEGVQLLCLTGKVGDACTYLRSSGHWGPALWLAKCRLGKKEYTDIVSKYCDHCVTQGRIQEAALMYLSVEDWLGCVETLHIGLYCILAAQLLDICPDLGKEDRVVVLTEAVWMEAAKYMAGVGNMEAAREYCRRAGEKGEEVRKELEMMVGKGKSCEVEE